MRFLQIGLGEIGRGIAAEAVRRGHALVGAIDPAFAGRPSATCIPGAPAEQTVAPNLLALFEGGVTADAAVHASGSFLEKEEGTLLALVARGLHVVSTCEELAYPFYRHPERARALNERAVSAGVVLLGTGVNPGFAMDKLVVTLASAVNRIDEVRVERVVDAISRRESFQRKIGAGLDRAAFDALHRAGRLGHVGLAESAHLIADACGFAAERRIDDSLAPVMGEQRIASAFVTVEPGHVAGLEQHLTLYVDEVARVRLSVKMALGAEPVFDRITIEGEPRIDAEIETGIPGDPGTIAVTVACIGLVAKLAPGLRTMLDVPLIHGAEA